MIIEVSMRLKKEQIQRLSRMVVKRLEEGGVELKKPLPDLILAVESVIMKNLETEDAIDRQARDTMDKFRNDINAGKVDPQKMFMMIKKQIAKERNFIL